MTPLTLSDQVVTRDHVGQNESLDRSPIMWTSDVDCVCICFIGQASPVLLGWVQFLPTAAKLFSDTEGLSQWSTCQQHLTSEQCCAIHGLVNIMIYNVLSKGQILCNRLPGRCSCSAHILRLIYIYMYQLWLVHVSVWNIFTSLQH